MNEMCKNIETYLDIEKKEKLYRTTQMPSRTLEIEK